MPADILVLKKRGEKFKIKISDSIRGNRYTPANCDIKVNLMNYKDLALFLEDLKILWSAPVDGAIEEYKRNQREKKGPFW